VFNMSFTLVGAGVLVAIVLILAVLMFARRD
jgi:hypothetical protein